MENIQLIEGKNAVLIPIKKWERVQNELVRLRKKVNKAEVLNDIRTGIIEIEKDLRREPHLRKIRMTADEFLVELENEK